VNLELGRGTSYVDPRYQSRWRLNKIPSYRPLVSDPLLASALAFDPLGELLAVASDHGVRVWRVGSPDPIRFFSKRGPFGDWKWLTWGTPGLSGMTNESKVYSWSWPACRWASRPATDQTLLADRDAHVVSDPQERRWLVRRGRRGRVLLPNLGNRVVGCHPREERVYGYAEDGRLSLISATECQGVLGPSFLWEDHSHTVGTDGDLLVVGASSGRLYWRRDGEWDFLQLKLGPARCVAASASSGLIAVADSRCVLVVSLAERRVIFELYGSPPATDVRFAADDHGVVCGFEDGLVGRFAPDSAPAWSRRPDDGRLGPRDKVVVDGGHAACWGQGRIVVWSLERGEEVWNGGRRLTTMGRPALRWPWLAYTMGSKGIRLVHLTDGSSSDVDLESWWRRTDGPLVGGDGSVWAGLGNPVAALHVQGTTARCCHVVLDGPGYKFLGPFTWTSGQNLAGRPFAPRSLALWPVVMLDCGEVDRRGAVVLGCPSTGVVRYRGPGEQGFRNLYRHHGSVTAVALSADGTRLASAATDGTVIVAGVNGVRLGLYRAPASAAAP
jgi:WD40 repeat protein